MGFFKNVLKTTINTALLPVDVAADCLGLGLLKDQPESLTVRRARKIKESAEDAHDDFEDWLDD